MTELTNETLKETHEKIFKEGNKFGDNEKLITKILSKYPENSDLDIIGMKIALIDSTCSTHLSMQTEKISIYEIATIIKESHFDKYISGKFKDKNPERIVEIILNKINDKYSVKPFSFVTKYCCYHNNVCYGRDDFSIYDRKVKENLGYYVLEEKDYKNKEEYNKAVYEYGKKLESQYKNKLNYIGFNNIINDILKNKSITLKNKRRLFDYYIWWTAKEDDKKQKEAKKASKNTKKA